MGGGEPRDGGRNHIFRSLKAAGLSISVKGLPKLSSLKQQLYVVHIWRLEIWTLLGNFLQSPWHCLGQGKQELPHPGGFLHSSLVPQFPWPVLFSSSHLTGLVLLTRWPHGCLIVLRSLREDQLPQHQSPTQALSLLTASLPSLRTLCSQSLFITQDTKVIPVSQGGKSDTSSPKEGAKNWWSS